MYKNRNMRGGNATSHSAEYYGGNSGSYYTTPPIAGGSAYGGIRPSSFGTIVGNETGPNLAVYPNGSLIQTGGNGCSYRKPQNGGNGCPYRKPQNGGRSRRRSIRKIRGGRRSMRSKRSRSRSRSRKSRKRLHKRK